MNMHKKSIRLYILCLCLIVMAGLTFGCAKKKDTTTSTTEKATTTTTAPTETETEAPTETDAPTETTEAETEVTSEQTTETTTEATTEATTKATTTEATTTKETTPAPTEAAIDEDGEYTSKDDVALYIYTYGHLPSNFVTKSEARAKGWEGGSLEDYFPGCSIGGDVFGNREGLLPSKKGRTYYECDIDTKGKSSRGAKRIVFSDDGLIYYTDDHYESFTLLYGEE